MIALIITNSILAVVIGLAGVALLVDMARNSRPIVIKEAKALREYYEAKLKDAEEKVDKAEQKYAEYKARYESELQRNSDRNNQFIKNAELEARVKRLNNDLSSCEDRINDMAQENASLKEQIKELEKPAKKRRRKEHRNNRRVGCHENPELLEQDNAKD